MTERSGLAASAPKKGKQPAGSTSKRPGGSAAWDLSEDVDFSLHSADPQAIVQLQSLIGNRRTAELLQRSSEQQSTPTLSDVLQLEREGEFRTDPQAFLRGNLLSLYMEDGMRARSDAAELKKKYAPFLKKMGSFTRHWFKLVPDAGRTRPERPAYNLTPAIEKYISAYPDDALLSEIAALEGIPAAAAEDQYISSAYVDYKNIGVVDPEETIGHADITTDREDEEADFNPDFVFTAAMNGCAFVVTPGEDESKFRAWHFQSPQSNRPQAAEFRKEQSPTDWFGAEEYDRGNHAGLFEVTNFLHRGANNKWNVISQQNEVSGSNINDVTTDKVTSRPLKLEGGDEVAIKKRIYLGLHEENMTDTLRGLQNVLKFDILESKTRVSVQLALQSLTSLMTQERMLIQNATTIEQMHSAAGDILSNRASNLVSIKAALESLESYFNTMYDTENKRFGFLKSEDKLKTWDSCAKNTASALMFFSRTAWASEMQSETAAD